MRCVRSVERPRGLCEQQDVRRPVPDVRVRWRLWSEREALRARHEHASDVRSRRPVDRLVAVPQPDLRERRLHRHLLAGPSELSERLQRDDQRLRFERPVRQHFVRHEQVLPQRRLRKPLSTVRNP